jgi:hypothetical protein
VYLAYAARQAGRYERDKMDIEEIQSDIAVDLLAENKKLQKAIEIADKDRQKAWRVIGEIEEILAVYNKRSKIADK